MCDAPYYLFPELYPPEFQKLIAELERVHREALRRSLNESVAKMQAELQEKREED